jgi:hypothetical protein
MIRSLRRAQPVWMLVCALLGTALLIAARLQQPSVPVEAEPAWSPPQATAVAEWLGPHTSGRVYHAAQPDRLWIELERLPLAPDVLLFATAALQLEQLRGLPADARCLGSLEDFRRPATVELGGCSRLLLYSLGHGRVLAQAELPPSH